MGLLPATILVTGRGDVVIRPGVGTAPGPSPPVYITRVHRFRVPHRTKNQALAKRKRKMRISGNRPRRILERHRSLYKSMDPLELIAGADDGDSEGPIAVESSGSEGTDSSGGGGGEDDGSGESDSVIQSQESNGPPKELKGAFSRLYRACRRKSTFKKRVFLPSLPLKVLREAAPGAPLESENGEEKEDRQADAAAWRKFATKRDLERMEEGCELEFEIKSDHEEKHETLPEEARRTREEAGVRYGYHGRQLSKTDATKRAAIQISEILINDGCNLEDGGNELLHAKMVAVLLPQYESCCEQLFRLRGGVKERVAGLASEDLKFPEKALKLAQAAWLALSWKPFKPALGSQEVAADLSHVVQLMPEDFRQHAAHGKLGRCWRGGFCKVLKTLRKHATSQPRSLVDSSRRYGNGEIDWECPGAQFDDIFLNCRGKPKQAPKSSKNNCYTKAPGKFGDEPGKDARQKLVRFITTVFAGEENPKGERETLSYLLAYLALIVRGRSLPDRFLVVIGGGGEGKSLLFGSLLSAVLGSGHSTVSSRALQVDREWQQQGESFLESRFLAFAECPKEKGFGTEAVKNLSASQKQPLRKNHQGETMYHRWNRCGCALLKARGVA